MTPEHRAQGDDGVILPIALAFVTVIALIIGTLLTQSATQFKATEAFRDRQAGIFAADAGLERALAGIDMISTSTNPDATPTMSHHERGRWLAARGSQRRRDHPRQLHRRPGPGTNRLVIVAVGNDDDNPPARVRFGPHDMHPLGQRAEIGTNSTSLYYLLLDGEFAPGLAAGNYDIEVRSSTVAPRIIRYTIHASLWTDILQQVDGSPFGPTNTGRAQSAEQRAARSAPT